MKTRVSGCWALLKPMLYFGPGLASASPDRISSQLLMPGLSEPASRKTVSYLILGRLIHLYDQKDHGR